MYLSIIIVNYNSKNDTDTCIKHIFRHPPKHEYEIFVVDNASHDGSIPYLKKRWDKHPVIFIQNKENAGFGKACNIAMKQAQGKYIALLNPDIEVQKNTFDILLQYLHTHKKTGLAGPQLVYEDGIIQDSYRVFPNVFDLIIKRTGLKNIPFFTKRVQKYLLWRKDKNKTEPVDWLVGAFWVVKKEVLEQVGYFDERYFLFFEDVDLCKRIWKQNYSVVYVAESKAKHYHKRLSEGGIKEVFTKKAVRIHITSAIKYFLKWGIMK